MLAQDDAPVWLGVHKNGDVVAASITAVEDAKDGAYAQIHLSFLLQQLKKLGDAGKALLQKLAKLAGIVIEAGGDAFAHLAQIAAAVGEKLLSIAQGVLNLDLGGGHFVRWNLHAQLPHLGIDFDLSKLIPEFNIELPSLPRLSVSLRPLRKLELLLGRIGPLDLHLGDLLGDLKGLSLPKMPAIDVGWIGDLLDVSIDLGDLFGTGQMSFGFSLPIGALLAKVGSGVKWLMSHLKSGKHPKAFAEFKLGADGVLRIFEPGKPEGTRIGFDLKQLFAGVSPENLVPVEMHADVDVKDHKVAEVSYGDDQISKADKDDKAKGDKAANLGKVLVPPPKGSVIGSVHVPAPAWVREHLGTPANSQVRASLYLEQDAKHSDAVLFASVDSSDRGVELRVHANELSKVVGSLGPVKAQDGISIDTKLSMAKGMLVVSFGKEKSATLHGHAGWRMENLLADPSLSSLVPDEVVIENKEGKLEMSNSIDVSGLQPMAKDLNLDGLEWAKHALGDAKEVTLFAGQDLKKNPRLALATERRKDGTRGGVELTVDKGFVATIEHKAHELADRTVAAAKKVFKRDRDTSKGDFKIHATAGGVTVDRGEPGTPQYMFATFSWNHLSAMISGDSESLVPDQLRVGTTSMALEMESLPHEAKRPPQAHEIDSLHPLLKEPLLAIGFQGKQLVDFDMQQSKLADAETQQVRAVASVWDVDGAEVTGGRQVALTLELEALLAQLIPSRKKWTKPKQAKEGAGTSFSASVQTTDDLNHDGKKNDPGVEMSAALHHETKSGKRRDLELDVGWSLAQILDVLLHMKEGKDGGLSVSAGALIPQRIHGSFSTDKFKIDFGNDGHDSKYNCPVSDVPGLPTLLGSVLDPETVQGSTLHLNIPSFDDIKDQIKEAAKLHAAYIPIAGCSLGVPTGDPKNPKYYEIMFSIEPAAFKKLLYLVPGLGTLAKAASLLLDVVSDPIGTAEAVANTPEALLDMVEAFPEVYGNAKKMGFKRIAMGLLLGNHPSVRQFVLANRIKKKMEAAGWKPGDPKPKEWDDIPPAYLEWLSKQDASALAEGAELDALARQSGIEIEKNYSIPPGGQLMAEDIKVQIDTLQHGFKELSDARDMEKEHPNGLAHEALAKQTKEKAEELRAHLHEVLESGVKTPEGAEASEHPSTSRDVDVTDGAVNKIGQAPTDAQAEEARSMFGNDEKDGRVIAGPEVEAWIQTYAGLSQEALGELLVSGRTIVQTPAGKREVRVAGDTQKAFVRALMVKRMNGAGQKVPKTADKPVDDATLVASQRKAEQRDKAQAGKGGDASAKKTGIDSADAAFDEDEVFGVGSKSNEAADVAAEAPAGGQHAALDGKGEGTTSKHADGTSEKTATSTQSADKSISKEAGRSSGNESAGSHRDWKLAEVLHIGAADIHNYVIVADNTVTLSPDGDKLKGYTLDFNGHPLQIQNVEILNIRQTGIGANKVSMFMLSIDAGVQGQVRQEYLVKGSGANEQFSSLDHKVDGRKLLEGFQHALKFNGQNWVVASTAPIVVDPYTLTIMGVGADDPGAEDLVVDVLISEIRTSSGYAKVVTADEGPKLVHAGDNAKLRVPAPNRHSS